MALKDKLPDLHVTNHAANRYAERIFGVGENSATTEQLERARHEIPALIELAEEEDVSLRPEGDAAYVRVVDGRGAFRIVIRQSDVVTFERKG